MGNVLIGCECSDVLASRFRLAGHNAWSCDLKPNEVDQKYHYQGDVVSAVTAQYWDLIILHPDCTAMAVSGNRWYGRGMPKNKERLDSEEWTEDLWHMAIDACDRVALENPVSTIFTRLKGACDSVCYVQPWEHGHGETKKTGFALHNLPPLVPSDIVEGREQRIWKMPPGPNRKADRSRTFTGIADAIVDQWGRLL